MVHCMRNASEWVSLISGGHCRDSRLVLLLLLMLTTLIMMMVQVSGGAAEESEYGPGRLFTQLQSICHSGH